MYEKSQATEEGGAHEESGMLARALEPSLHFLIGDTSNSCGESIK